MNAREAALKVLMDVGQNQAYANISIKRILSGANMTPEDRRLATEIAYGTLEWRIRLDWMIGRYLRSPIASPEVREILRLGAYQICFLDRVPNSAAVDEAVKLTRKTGHESLTGFVNTVLRKLSVEWEDIELPNRPMHPMEYLSVRYSMPEWIVRMWAGQMGEQETERLLSTRLTHDTCVHPNPMRISRQDFLARLEERGMPYTLGKLDEDAVYLGRMGNIAQDEMYQRGEYSVQGEASMWAARLAQPRAGMDILDACAAPGGKTMRMAELSQNGARIDAWDVHEHRVQLIVNAAQRLGAANINTQVRDARRSRGGEDKLYDAVLLDVPCSGLGTLSHRPELKYRLSRKDIASLCADQSQILNACAKRVKRGGVLIYATCTINREENTERIARFLKDWPEFKAEMPENLLPPGVDPARVELGGIQLLPQLDGCDGFYAARLVRRT
nr:16S rRNA (cytosine(967)-C(5))-methyltransferase RsmB [bacterium]